MYDVSADFSSAASVSLSMDAPVGNSSGSFVPLRAMSFNVSDNYKNSYELVASPEVAQNLDLDHSPASLPTDQFDSSLGFGDLSTPNHVSQSFDLTVSNDILSNQSFDSVFLDAAPISSEVSVDFDSIDFDTIASAVSDIDTGWLNIGAVTEPDLASLASSDIGASVLSQPGSVDSSFTLDSNLYDQFVVGSLPDLGSSSFVGSDLGTIAGVDDVHIQALSSMSIEIGIADQSINISGNISSSNSLDTLDCLHSDVVSDQNTINL